jgi:general secretion pathway protein J
MGRPESIRGFTLLELLIAISIFALLSLMAYSALSSAVRQRQQGEQEAYEMKGLQMGLLWLERDLQQAVDRPVQAGGELEPAFEYRPLDGLLSLTRTGWSNPLGQARGQLQRIAYRFDKGKLYRDNWFHLDRLADEPPQEAVLLEGLEDWKLRFMNFNRQWQEQWPPRDANGVVTEALPLAVEFRFRKQGWGEIRRIVRLAGS